MRSLALLPAIWLALSSCGNKSPQKDVLDWGDRDSISNFDDSITHSDEQKTSNGTAKEHEIKRIEGASSGTLSTNRVKQDNMRGFDPASEDDMDDNGMSRYMENDDDEGWD